LKNRAYLSLGTNMGDRLHYLFSAIRELNRYPSIQLVNYSSVYETDPVGYKNQELFLNMVVEIATNSDSLTLLKICQEIERIFGRKREMRWGPRTIDLDILVFNQENIETESLCIPHPRMSERAFVLVPLHEIAGNISLPGFEKPLTQTLELLPDREGVRIWKLKNGEDGFGLLEN
jgi:2-amino-4-hydroxy-6-hydroxymethyldihydropteridine diphosphokinase